ncbi:MAG: hypothetical protein R3245_05525, partial [Kiloniellales bacterium]|nr:hypothetical protein [Kiloniellales bacterium]
VKVPPALGIGFRPRFDNQFVEFFVISIGAVPENALLVGRREHPVPGRPAASTTPGNEAG